MAFRNKRLRKRLFRVLPIVAVLAAILTALVLVSDVEQDTSGFSRNYVWVLVLTGAALVLLFITIVARSYSLARKVRQESPGARLSVRWIRNFLMLSLPPALIVYFFSAWFLTRTVDNWFDVEVETALGDSLALGQEFLAVRTLEVRNQMQRMSLDIEGLEDDPDRLRRALLRRVSTSGPVELSVLEEDGSVISTANFDPLSDLTVHPEDFALVQATELGEYARVEPMADGRQRIRVIRQMPAASPGDPDLLLQAIFPLPDNVTGLTESIQAEYSRFQTVSYLRDSLKQSFLLILTLVLALTVLMAILAALGASRRMVKPISNLATATRKVASGDLDHAVETQSRDELGFLAQSFNEMTEALLKASDEAETARANLQAQGEYLETVLGSLSAGVLTLDSAGRVVRANRAAEQILTLPDGYAAKRQLKELSKTAPFLEPFAEVILNQLKRDRVDWQQEVRLDQPDIALVLLVRGSRLPSMDGEKGGHVVVFDDVTILNQAQRDAAWAEVAKRLAHEVKNPLTPIRLAAERLRMKLMDKLEAKDAEMLDRSASTIVSQVEALGKLVDAFSDYAREPEFERADLDLEKLIRDVVALYRDGYPKLDLQLELCPGPPGLTADGGQIRQLLHNLIRNANEAAEKDGQVAISIRTGQEDVSGEPWLKLQISDNGPGFPKTVLENPFEPYVSFKPNGSGLGLAICRKIVTDHDGKISIGNPSEGGALASILLPLKKILSQDQEHRDTA
jgi:nitrogen fixation/metabolism regulation signal transduction histidine kinase